MTERKEVTSLTATVYCEDCGSTLIKSGVSGKNDVGFGKRELETVGGQALFHTQRTGHKNITIKLS